MKKLRTKLKSAIALCIIVSLCVVMTGCASKTNEVQNSGEIKSTNENNKEASEKTDVTGDQSDLGSVETANSQNEADNAENLTQSTSADDESANTESGKAEKEEKFDGKTLSFDTEKSFQTIDGFGAAYTWYAERLLNSKYSEEGFDALFKDAGMNILRFKNEYEYSIEDKASNATTMAKYYKAARERAAERGERVLVLLCCWSPPAKLKSDNSIDVGTGTLRKNADGGYCYEEYGEWWAESVKYYESFGIKIDYISIQNEVDFAPDDYEGCLFGSRESDTKASYSKAFLAVYYALQKEFGSNAPLMLGPETMTCAPATLSAYTKEIRDTEPDALAGYAFHLYQGGTIDSDTNNITPSSFNTNFRSMGSLLDEASKKWETEFYHGKGIQTAQLICNALTVGNLNAYLYWSGVWADSTPNLFESADLIEVRNDGSWRTSANYYALRHFSEFIRPGYIRIDTKSGDSSIKVCGFTNQDKNKLSFVIVNPTEEEILYRIKGNDYTITASRIVTSVFTNECESSEQLFIETGSLSEGNTLILPALSVTSVDVTGYYGNTVIPVKEIVPLVYEDDIITEFTASKIPSTDVVILETSFDEAKAINSFSSFGSSKGTFVEESEPGKGGYLKVSNRTQDWNGLVLSSGFFEHYGYMLYVSFDCMMEKGGYGLSCTSSFQMDKKDQYPSLENTRVTVPEMEAGKWYHAEGYMTMFRNMDPETFRIYWESAGNTEDFCLDNISVKVLYTKPAGDFE